MNDVRFIDIVRTTKKQTKENHTLGGKEMIYGNKDRQTILIEEGESTNKVFHLMMEIPLDKRVEDNSTPSRYPFRVIETKEGKAILAAIADFSNIQLILANKDLLENKEISKEYLKNEYLPKINKIIMENPLLANGYVGINQLEGAEFQILLITKHETYLLLGDAFGSEGNVSKINEFTNCAKKKEIKSTKKGKEFILESFYKSYAPSSSMVYINTDTFKEEEILNPSKKPYMTIEKNGDRISIECRNNSLEETGYLANVTPIRESANCYLGIIAEERTYACLENIPDLLDKKDDLDLDYLVKHTLPKIINSLEEGGRLTHEINPYPSHMNGSLIIATRNHLFEIDECLNVFERKDFAVIGDISLPDGQF